MKKFVFIVGRSPSCNTGETPIIINDSTNTVSSTHCRIIVENGLVYIEDLNSTNGTFINGNRINQAVKVDLSSSIMLGKRLQFRLTHPSIQNVLTAFKKEEIVKHAPFEENPNNSVPLKKQLDTTQYASFGERLVGYLLDGLIMGLISIPILIMLRFIMGSYLYYSYIIFGQLLFIVALLIITHLYYAVPISKKGYTIGRKAMGIIYLDEKTRTYPSKGQVWARLFGYLLSSALLMIGFLTMLGDTKHQALHDKIAGTIVVKIQ
ncbi:MAG TPA: RDD family protein [Bacteroidales bacterium]|nr:RDD family protein [Bacteroidales bacterium]